MTSTSINVGLNDGTRLSSRVLRPPGGGHTDIFGGEPEPTRGRRAAPPQPATNVIGQGDEPKSTNGNVEAVPRNGPESQPQAQAEAPEPIPEAKPEPKESRKQAEPAGNFNQPEPVKAEPPKRVRVPPGGFSSGLCVQPSKYSFYSMEHGRKSRLRRFLNRLCSHSGQKYSLDKGISFNSTAMSESTGCGSTAYEQEEDDFSDSRVIRAPDHSEAFSDEDHFTPNIDLRYGGQYMTPEQLPEFCDQLHNLVEVIRNIQAYAQITGEYPAELERCLEREAREVGALAAETRNACDVIQRTRVQRRALHDHRKQLHEQLTSLKDTEVRELESTIRLSDRKLYKSWETLKDSSDPAAFEPLLEEIRNKQVALECLVRLIDGRRATLFKTSAPSAQPLPPPILKDEEDSSTQNASTRKRHERRASKRRRNKEPRSVPLSSEPSAHTYLPQVTLYIQGSDPTGRRMTSVPITPLELPSGGSVRDILFFTTHTA